MIALGVWAFFLQGCHSSEDFSAIKRIINDTPYKLNIHVYSAEGEHQFESGGLDTLVLTGKCYAQRIVRNCDNDWTYSYLRSELIFDGVKILSFDDACADGAASIAWDPFECAGYEQSDVQNDTWVFTYRITTADYDAATPIDG